MIQQPDTKSQFTAVSGRTHLFRRENGTFYFRRGVPLELRKILGKTEYRISLRTTEFKKAARELPAKNLFVDREFARAEAELAGEKPRNEPISDEELRWMANKAFVELETKFVFQESRSRKFRSRSRPFERAHTQPLRISRFIRDQPDSATSANSDHSTPKLRPLHMRCPCVCSVRNWEREPQLHKSPRRRH